MSPDHPIIAWFSSSHCTTFHQHTCISVFCLPRQNWFTVCSKIPYVAKMSNLEDRRLNSHRHALVWQICILYCGSSHQWAIWMLTVCPRDGGLLVNNQKEAKGIASKAQLNGPHTVSSLVTAACQAQYQVVKHISHKALSLSIFNWFEAIKNCTHCETLPFIEKSCSECITFIKCQFHLHNVCKRDQNNSTVDCVSTTSLFSIKYSVCHDACDFLLAASLTNA